MRPCVLVLDHTAQQGGAELALLRVAEVLRAEGTVELRVLLFADGPLRAQLAAAGVQAAVLPLDTAIATAARDRVVAGAMASAVDGIRFVLRLVRAIRGSGADLVVANSLKSAVFAFFAAPLARRRWIWHLHDRLASDYLPPVLAKAMRLIALLGPRAIVTNSRATLDTLPDRARRKSVVAYPGVRPDAFRSSGEPPEDDVVGILGRVSPTKGQREFLEAAALVAAERQDVRFAVIGGALFGEIEYEAEMRALAEQLGVAHRVEFSGWVSDAAPRLRALTVLVHASPTPEPFGQVIVEAMAAGVPVIATAAGGVPEILDPEGRCSATSSWCATTTGILVKPGDHAALAAAMNAALDDADSRRRRADAARADAEKRFTITRTASTIEGVWRRSLRAGVRRGP
jgi:glycosyltransferase involved in cell wall biosynthesis